MNEHTHNGAYSEKNVTARAADDVANGDDEERAYRLARLIRSGSRELERQLNIKKTR